MFRERIEKRAPSIIERDSINQAVETGQLVIDSLFPIGRGQRQLIIGDKKTGKTTIALDLILSQKINENNKFLNLNQNLFTIITSIGQKQADVLNILLFFGEYKLLNTVSVVLASASNAAPLQYMAPFVGCTLGEFYRNNGFSAVAVYDDLSKHATAYRQLALLLRRPPGREAFPSDIFYLHARLLERAGRLHKNYSGGSLTAFPVVETQAGDISAYIPTNIISITDGQLFLDYELFSKGHRPAIHTGLSVSRIGSSAQSKLMKDVVGSFKLLVAQLKQLERFESFASDLDQSIRNDILRGKVITSLLRQFQHVVYPILDQVLLILFSVNLDLDDLEGIIATDYGYFVKDLIRFLYSDSNYNYIFNETKEKYNYNFSLWQLNVINKLFSKSKNPVVTKNKLVLNNISHNFDYFNDFIEKLDDEDFNEDFNENLMFNGFLHNSILDFDDNNIENLNGIFNSNVNFIDYSFNYWTSFFYLPFFASYDFLFNKVFDFLSTYDCLDDVFNSNLLEKGSENKEELSENYDVLDLEFSELNDIIGLFEEADILELIGPFLNLKDLEFYEDSSLREFLIELLSFVSFEIYSENKNIVELILKYSDII